MVSVVIPTHNRTALLQRAIASVQAQTYRDLEIIVVSDGSTDDTKQIVEDAAAKDSRIHFIEYYPARGGNVARNTGIAAATGEYVAFLDDDDQWLPEKLEKQINLMSADQEIGLVYTGVTIIYETEGVTYQFTPVSSGDLSERILLNNCIGTTSTVLAKKALLTEVGLFDVKLKAMQDYDLWIRCCQKTKVGMVREPMIRYYNYQASGKLSAQVSADTQKYVDALFYINNKYSNLLAALTPEMKKEKAYNEYVQLTNKAMRNGDKKQARKYARELMKVRMDAKAVAYFAMSFLDYQMVLKLRSKI